MKNLKLFVSVLFISVSLLSCSKSKNGTGTPAPVNSNSMDLSVKLTFTNFDPTKDILVGSFGGTTTTAVYSDWSVNGVERKGEDAFAFDNSFIVNNMTIMNTNSKINNASLTIGGVAPQSAPFTITIQATKNGKLLDPVTVQIAGSSTVRSITY